MHKKSALHVSTDTAYPLSRHLRMEPFLSKDSPNLPVHLPLTMKTCWPIDSSIWL